MKYFLYVRKSSEADEKQIQSIDDQINYWKERMTPDMEIINVFSEEHSAKEPGKRTIFNAMMDRIDKWEAKGILCWKLDRLTRNPVDTGRIQWLLQKNKLEKILTSDREYYPVDSGLLFSVETGMANQFIIDLSKNTKRGMKWKADRGGTNGPAPQGYLNDRLEKTVIIDPERFDLVKRMWKLMITWNYTPPKVAEIANEEWGFRTRRSKKRWGVPLWKSMAYQIFGNPFYAGLIRFNGELFQWKHEAMITMEEFERVQELIWNPSNPRPIVNDFPYVGTIHCGECGCVVTGQEKTKINKKTGVSKSYMYYHCTHRRDTPSKKCSQRQMLSEADLEAQIKEIIENISIVPDFLEWALDVLKSRHQTEIADRQSIYDTINTSINLEQKKLDKLTDHLLNEIISPEEYKKKKDEMKKNILSLQSKRGNVEHRVMNWLELTENAFKFASFAHTHFNTGNIQTKKEILRSLGQSFILKEKKIQIELNPWFIPFKILNEENNRQYRALELTKKGTSNELLTPFSLLVPKWLPE